MVLLSTVRSTSMPVGRGLRLFGTLRSLLLVLRFLLIRSRGDLRRCGDFFIGRKCVIFCAVFAVFPIGTEGNCHADSQQQAKIPVHLALPPLTRPRTERTKNARISTATMVEPTGVPARMEVRITGGRECLPPFLINRMDLCTI